MGLFIWLTDFFTGCPAPSRTSFLNSPFFFHISTTSSYIFILFSNSCSSIFFRLVYLTVSTHGTEYLPLAFSGKDLFFLVVSWAVPSFSSFGFFLLWETLISWTLEFHCWWQWWHISSFHLNIAFFFLLQIFLKRESKICSEAGLEYLLWFPQFLEKSKHLMKWNDLLDFLILCNKYCQLDSSSLTWSFAFL